MLRPASLTPVCRSPLLDSAASEVSTVCSCSARPSIYTGVAGLRKKSIFCVRWLNCWKVKQARRSPRSYKCVSFLKSISNIMANLGFSVHCSKLQWQWSGVNVECISEVLRCVEHIAEIECRCASVTWCQLNAIFRVFCVQFIDVQNNCNCNWNIK